MNSLLIKLLAFPAWLGVANFLFPDIEFTTPGALMLVGVVLAIVAHLLDLLLLRRVGVFWSAIADGIVFLLILANLRLIYPAVFLSFPAALWVAFFAAAGEYFTHLHALVRT